jgi:very-short-patch-repair endonuclease
VTEIATHSGTELRYRPLEEVAARQHGVFALWQVRLSASAVRSRVSRGKLHRIRRGVYSLSPVLTAEARFMAAVLACGPHAVLSHRSAAHVWAIRPTSRPLFEVTVPHGAAKSKTGIQVHEARHIKPVLVDGIPCTSVARTIVDCAEILPLYSIENMIDRAEQLHLFDLRAVEAELCGRHGAKPLGRVLRRYRPDPGTRNRMERIMLGICRANDFPEPEVNVYVAGEERDFVWRDRRVIAETDGRERHDTTRQFEEDRRKDQTAIAAGWTVLRFTWRQIADEPARVAAVLAAVLTRPPS